MAADTFDDLLDFWFKGELATYRGHWFREEPAFDAACQPFAELFRRARAGALAEWLDEPLSALALVILLDQFPRNLFRGSPEAFAADPLARDAARAAIERGFDQKMPLVARMFFYLPFEHSEDILDQDLSVQLFSALGDNELSNYAGAHYEVIRHFGRFPQRNAVLGRVNTPEETEYLADKAKDDTL